MTNKELLEEIRINRAETQALHKEISELKSELSLFKGKALGFISILSIVINAGISLLKTKG